MRVEGLKRSVVVAVTSDQPVPREAWSIVSGRWESGRLYVSVGKLDTSIPAAAETTHGTAPVIVGESFVGMLDEVRLFDLSKQPLSTFANGQQSISFTADASGVFETQIVSTGALTREVQGLRSGQTPDAGGTLTEESYGHVFTTAEASWEDSAETAETDFEYVGAKLMGTFAKLGRGLFVGSGGGGDIDLAVLAGDMLGSILLAPVTIVRDVFNALDRVIALKGNTADGLDLALAVVNVAAVLVKGKVGTLVQGSKFIKLMGRNTRASGAVARLVALEARVAAGAGGVSRIRKLLEVANLSYAAGQAVKAVVEVVGSREDSVEHASNVMDGADDPAGVTEDLAAVAGETPPEDMRLLLEAAGEPEPEAAAAAAAAPGKAVAAAATPSKLLLRWSRQGLKEGLARTGKYLRETDLGIAAKTFARRLRWTLGIHAPEVCERLGHVAKQTPERFELLLKGLASWNVRTWQGAHKVLGVAAELSNAATRSQALSKLGLPAGAFKLKGFEEKQLIQFLSNGAGKARQRFYDILVEIEGRIFRLEVKNWTQFPPGGTALPSAVNQMRRDLVKHLTEPGFSLEQVRWVFPSGMQQYSGLIRQEMRKAVDAEFVQALIRSGASAEDVVEAIDRAHKALAKMLVFL